jgi:hypothetical protein
MSAVVDLCTDDDDDDQPITSSKQHQKKKGTGMGLLARTSTDRIGGRSNEETPRAKKLVKRKDTVVLELPSNKKRTASVATNIDDYADANDEAANVTVDDDDDDDDDDAHFSDNTADDDDDDEPSGDVSSESDRPRGN